MTPSIYIPILLVLSLPILLWLLGQVPFRMSQPGARFKLSCVLILSLWCAAKVVIDLWYWFAGLLFILACLLFAFMVWSVLCWGYTLCMLLALEEHKDRIDADEWQKLHAGPQGMRQLTIDRIQVLLNFRLATYNQDQLVISRSGKYLANFSMFFMTIFGVK